MNALSEKNVEDVLRTRWSGKNYSERVWANTEKLGKKLEQVMADALHRGADVKKMAQEVAPYLRQGYGLKSAERLIQTELNYVQNQAALASIRDAGFKYFRFIAVLDARTTLICREHDGGVFSVDDGVGQHMPPLHVRCRSTIAASFGEGKDSRKGTRMARDVTTGKSIRVPAWMKYEDWKTVFVNKGITGEQWNSVVKHGIIKTEADLPTIVKGSAKLAGHQCIVAEEDKYDFGDGASVQSVRDVTTYIAPDGTRFVFPKDLDKQKQSMTPEKAIELWMRTPEEVRIRSCGEIRFVDYYNPLDSYWLQQPGYKNAGFTYSYATGGDKITFYQYVGHSDDYVIDTYCHETGHYIDVKLGSNGKRYCELQDWQDAMKKDFVSSGKKSPDKYGEASPMEDFAVSVANFELKRAEFEKDFPERTKLLKKIFKKQGASS